MRRLGGAALLLCCTAWADAPLGEVWPYKLKVGPGGAVDYVYDLRPIKKAGSTVDAVAAHGEAAVGKFLKALPDEAVVRLKPGAALSLAGAGGLEEAALAPTFSQVSSAKLLTQDPLGKGEAAKLMPALHPDEPRVLVSADAVLWRVRQFEDGVAAAIESDADRARKELLQKLFDKAMARSGRVQGDAREGAWALAARLAVAVSCMDAAKLPAAAKGADLKELVKVEMEKSSLPPEVAVPPHAHDWTPELVCSHVRQWVLRQPFAGTRGGAAAPLTLLALLHADAKLGAQWEELKARRDAFFGKPVSEPLDGWKAKALPSAAQAIDDLGPFLESLGAAPTIPPGLWEPPATPVRRFFDGLQGAERANAVEELFAAAQDGRVGAVATADASWAEVREAAWGALASGDVGSKERALDADWRDRLAGLFFALQGAHHETRGGDRERPEPTERSELLVKLKVPPHLEVEPLPLAYTRAAESLERLATLLAAQKLTAIRAMGPTGQLAEGAALAEAKRLARVMRGLAWVASPKGSDEPSEAKDARAFLAGWRSDAVLTREVREAFAGPLTVGESRPHAGVVGVGRRPLAVGFSSAPTIEIQTKATGLEPDAYAEQVYLVPVLVTVGAQAAAGAMPLQAPRWRKLVDAAGKKRSASEGAFLEAVSGVK